MSRIDQPAFSCEKGKLLGIIRNETILDSMIQEDGTETEEND